MIPDEFDVKDWRSEFDDRQQKEIEFCQTYAIQYAHGTDGHNAKLIIAKFAAMFDDVASRE